MIVLGLHFGHDGTACIVRDGRLVSALASERLSRSKKSAGVPDDVLDAVLRQAGVTFAEVDAIALTDWYHPWAHGLCDVYAGNDTFTNECGYPIAAGDWVHDTWNRIWDDDVKTVEVHIRGRSIRGYNVGHQKAHCASAFYTSPFKDAWCISMDSSGAMPKNNFMVARGSGNCLYWHDTPICMAGVLYGHICDQLQIGAQIFKAGSMMALAGYGTVYDWVRDRINCLAGGAFFAADADYHKWLRQMWEDLRGGRTFTRETSDSDQAQDVAASVQFIFEQAILKVFDHIPDDSVRNVCLSGGSFLNCNANTAVLGHPRVDRVHLFPGATDDGCAVGAALYVAHHILGEKRAKYKSHEICYLGPDRPGALGSADIDRVAKAIAAGKIVAWYQGRSEFGPRALGNRSMLADPRVASNRDRINFEIKKREWYRPLAPAVLAEKSQEWFDFPCDSPYMLFTAPCKRAAEIPAAVHVDGTARMQTVRKADNPTFYALIKRFGQITGVPVLLNTSLNVDGQPIIETAADALALWESTPVDMMVLNGEIYER